MDDETKAYIEEVEAERNYYRKALQDVQHIVANAAMFFSEQAKAEREPDGS